MCFLFFRQRKFFIAANLLHLSASCIEALDSKFSDESDELVDEGLCGPEKTYRGPHIVFPLQKKDVDVLIDFFRKKKVSRLDTVWCIFFYYYLFISFFDYIPFSVCYTCFIACMPTCILYCYTNLQLIACH